MRNKLTLASIAVLAVLSASAMPAGATERIHIQASTSPDGEGRLLATNGRGPWTWTACGSAITRCIPFGKGREIETGRASSGTVFRVESNGASGTSPQWRGRIRQVTPPSIEGDLVANNFVSPVPGVWGGGWEGEYSEMQLSACATSDEQGCTTLTDVHYVRGCAPSASFVLDAAFTGSYLRVAERRIGVGRPAEAAYGVTTPYGGKIWPNVPNTSASVLGQIEPAVLSYPGECGPPRKDRGAISKQGGATVECPAGCRAVLIGILSGREVRSTRNLPEKDALVVGPPARMRIPCRTLLRSGTDSVRMILKIDGAPAARRTIPIVRVR
jgi:hypothetical protein